MVAPNLLLVLNSITLAIIVFTSHILLLRSARRQVYVPLAICLFCIGILVCDPTLESLAPNLRVYFLIFSLPAMLLIAPCIWFYARGLTSESEWQLRLESKRHLLPAAVGMAIAVITLLLPEDIKHELLVLGDEGILEQTNKILRYFIYAVLICTFALVMGWIVQSGYYFVQIIRLLNRYRIRLKDIFASTESREIQWLSWLLVAVGLAWFIAAIALISDNFYLSVKPGELFMSIVVLVLVWSLAVWGLRQKPGFEELYNEAEPLCQAENKTVISEEKYQRSALNEQHISTIARQLENAMQEDKLYRDASLSLHKLSRHIGKPPNYISQTLSQSLGKNFFDYVNFYRVEAAKQLLSETEKGVLDIAMDVGFNAKSSFYTAFKKELKITPGQYRKQQQKQ